MGSKTISVNDDVYRELKEIKEENESFSELFHRLITIHHQNLEKSFGSWQLTKEEEEEICTYRFSKGNRSC